MQSVGRPARAEKGTHLDERSSEADLLDKVGATVLCLRGKSLSGSTVLSEESADIEGRHLRAGREGRATVSKRAGCLAKQNAE